MDNPEQIRKHFEECVARSRFKDNTPLGFMTFNGEFSHYMDPDTDTLWLGFIMGMICAEKLSSGRSKLLALFKTRIDQIECGESWD